MDSSEPEVLIRRQGRPGHIVLNRPHRHNALDAFEREAAVQDHPRLALLLVAPRDDVLHLHIGNGQQLRVNLVGDRLTLREVRDYKGKELVDGVLALVREHKPLHLSIVGGDPMVRLFELEELLPQLTEMGIHCQVVTSAFRRIPPQWAENPRIIRPIRGVRPPNKGLKRS